jgi:hypothetical protein
MNSFPSSRSPGKGIPFRFDFIFINFLIRLRPKIKLSTPIIILFSIYVNLFSFFLVFYDLKLDDLRKIDSDGKTKILRELVDCSDSRKLNHLSTLCVTKNFKLKT